MKLNNSNNLKNPFYKFSIKRSVFIVNNSLYNRFLNYYRIQARTLLDQITRSTWEFELKRKLAPFMKRKY